MPWMKFALIGIVLIGVAVFSGRAGLEKILKLKPGTLGGSTASNNRSDDSSDAPKFDVDLDWKNQSNNNANSTSGSDSSDFELIRDGYVMKSPEGLTYYIGDRGENRIDHVLLHTRDNTSKPVHGIFVGSKNEIFAMIDEAYKMVKSNSNNVLKTKPENGTDKVAYDVDMGRKIGYKGGRNGNRDGNPDLTILRLVLNKKIRVITAFPAR